MNPLRSQLKVRKIHGAYIYIYNFITHTSLIRGLRKEEGKVLQEDLGILFHSNTSSFGVSKSSVYTYEHTLDPHISNSMQTFFSVGNLSEMHSKV